MIPELIILNVYLFVTVTGGHKKGKQISSSHPQETHPYCHDYKMVFGKCFKGS